MLHTFNLKDAKLTRISKPDIDPSKLSLEDVAKLGDLLKKTKDFKSGVAVDDAITGFATPVNGMVSVHLGAGTHAVTIVDAAPPWRLQLLGCVAHLDDELARDTRGRSGLASIGP